jgi:hypothetical protein
MSPEQTSFLNLRDKPARLDVQQAGWYLGFNSNEISLLVANGMLKPLGSPRRSAVKYFALSVLRQLRDDVKWMSKATAIIYGKWRKKNHTEDPESGIDSAKAG